MKKLMFLPLAAFIFAACSESTAPDSDVSSVTPRFGQNPPAAPPPPVCEDGSANCATWEDGFGIASAGDIAISSASATTSPNGENFAGRWSGETVVLSVPNAGSSVTLTFKLYTIGAWGGQPRKAAPHLWQLATQCGTEGAIVPVINASFSNRDGSQQSWPNNYGVGKTSDAYSGSSAINALNYLAGGTNYYNVRTTDVADATYQITRTVTNSCDAGEFRFVMQGLNATSIGDRSWGIDNLSVQ
jgi:hypothetical protein